MYVTYCSTSEGAGAQFQRVLALLAICKIHKLKYVHKKLTIGHNYENDPEWNARWDALFNIQSLSYSPIYILDSINIFKLNQNDIPQMHLHNDKLFSVQLPFDVVDRDPNKYYKAIQDEAIKAYDQNSKLLPLFLYDKNKKNIAIHIRVINSHDDDHEFKNYDTLSGRFNITDQEYLQLINKLKSDYANHNIHIFTQTNIFIKYKLLTDLTDIHIHIDTDPFNSFHHMCKADVLIIARSSFSYLAGLYNKNKVIYLPFHHPPLDTWQSIDNYINS